MVTKIFKRITKTYLYKSFNILPSLITSIILFNFWNLDKKSTNLLNFFSGNLSFLQVFLAGMVALMFFLLAKNYLDKKLTIYYTLSSFVLLPISLFFQNQPIMLKTFSLYAIFLSIPLCILIFGITKNSKLKSSTEHKNTGYILFAFFTTIYSVFALIRHYSFKSNGQDLGVYIQTIYELGHSLQPQLTNLYFIIHPFGVHFEPILYVFVPFGYLRILAPVLLISQVLGVTIGIIGIFKLAKFFKLDSVIPFFTSLAYTISPAIQHGLVFDFHTTMLMPSFIIFIFYFILKKDHKWTLLTSLLFLLVKEDTSVYVFFFGLYAIWNFKDIRLGGILMFLGSVYGALAVGKIIPHFGDGKVINFVFTKIGNSFGEVINTIITKPFFTFKTFFSPVNVKLPSLASTFLHGGLLPFFGYKELLLLVPIFGMRFFSEHPRMWEFSMYYAAPSVAVITVAILVACSKKYPKKSKIVLPSLVFGVVFSILLGTMPYIPGYYSSSIYRKLLEPTFYTDLISPDSQSVREALKLIPKNASICTSQGISAHVSTRHRSTFLGSEVCDKSYEYFLVNTNMNNWPLSKESVEGIISDLEKDPKYSLEYSKNGTILYSK